MMIRDAQTGLRGPGPRWSDANSVRTMRSLWKSLPDAMVVTDANGTVRAANPAYCARHGSTPQLLIGQSIALTYPEPERVTAMAHYRAIFASRVPPHTYPVVSQWQDDAEQVTESRIAFATQQDGQTFMVSSVRVISGQVRPEPTQLFPQDDRADRDHILGGIQEGPVRGEHESLVSGPGVLSAAELIVNAIEDWGVEMAFGLRGDAPIDRS